MLGWVLRALAALLAACAGGVLGCHAAGKVELRGRAVRRLSAREVANSRPLCFALLAAVGCMAAAAVSPAMLPVCLLAAWVFSGKAPQYLQRREAKALQEQCESAAAEMADMVALAARSGLSFDAALDLYCSLFDNPLAAQMALARNQWRNGVKTRREALEERADATGSKSLRQFAETSLQAVESGAPLADLLEQLACELRSRRQAEVEKRVEKAPVKMLVPTGLLILPAMLILVMGPALLQLMGAGE